MGDVISTLKEKFKAEYIVNMLVGNETSEIQSYKHNELDVFASGQDQDEKTREGTVVEVKETPKGYYVIVEFDE